MMRVYQKRLIAVAALAVAYATGANNGYELGADTMQCVAFGSLNLADKTIARDACAPLEKWSKLNPAFVARKFWIDATRQSIPDSAFSQEQPQ